MFWCIKKITEICFVLTYFIDCTTFNKLQIDTTFDLNNKMQLLT